MIPSKAKRTQIHREFETPQEQNRFRRYHWMNMPIERLGGLLIGASYQQANWHRVRPYRPGVRSRWQAIRGLLIRELEARGAQVPKELQRAHVRPPFMMRPYFQWQRALTAAATPTRATAARAGATER